MGHHRVKSVHLRRQAGRNGPCPGVHYFEQGSRQCLASWITSATLWSPTLVFGSIVRPFVIEQYRIRSFAERVRPKPSIIRVSLLKSETGLPLRQLTVREPDDGSFPFAGLINPGLTNIEIGAVTETGKLLKPFPATVTTTLYDPSATPGTVALMDVAVQSVTEAVAKPNTTLLPACLSPNPVPVMVTVSPGDAGLGTIEAMVGPAPPMGNPRQTPQR